MQKRGENPAKLVVFWSGKSFTNRDGQLCSSYLLRFHFSNEPFEPLFFLQNMLAIHIFSNTNLNSHPLITSRDPRGFIFETKKVLQTIMRGGFCTSYMESPPPAVFHTKYQTAQELRMLSSVSLNCQVTKIVMDSGS